MNKLVHPWRNIKSYINIRFDEAKFEFTLAEKFLKEGLLRNAAVKAFQAWKAILAIVSALNRDYLSKYFKGKVRTRDGKIVSKIDWIIVIMPTGLMRTIAQLLEPIYGYEIVFLTDLAINLHEFQYNGLDETGCLSRYTRIELVEQDIKRLIEWGSSFLEKLKIVFENRFINGLIQIDLLCRFALT